MGPDEAAITLDIALAWLPRPTTHDPPRPDPMRDKYLAGQYKRPSPQPHATSKG